MEKSSPCNCRGGSPNEQPLPILWSEIQIGERRRSEGVRVLRFAPTLGKTRGWPRSFGERVSPVTDLPSDA
jgi:hypothetical protein